jgi:hypothetical protein
MREKEPAFRCRLYAAVAAHKHRLSQKSFQLMYRMGQRRLGDMQRLRRIADAAELGNGNGGKEVPEIQIFAFETRRARSRFLSSFGPIRQHFALKRHLLCASLYRKQLAARIVAWCELTDVTHTPSSAF